MIVWDAEHDLRRSVKSTLNVSIHYFVFKTPGAIVNDLYPTFGRCLQQYILRLKVAMNYSVVPCELQRMQDLNGKSSNKAHAHTTEVCGLDELIHVDTQDFKDDADVRPEYKVFFDLNDVGCVVRVVLS